VDDDDEEEAAVQVYDEKDDGGGEVPTSETSLPEVEAEKKNTRIS